MREPTDLEISAQIRRELSSRRIDLSKIKFQVSSGNVSISGEFCFAGFTKSADETAVELKFLENALNQIKGVKNLKIEFTNWAKNNLGSWEPITATKQISPSLTGANEGIFVCQECNTVIKFCPCCGKPLSQIPLANQQLERTSNVVQFTKSFKRPIIPVVPVSSTQQTNIPPKPLTTPFVISQFQSSSSTTLPLTTHTTIASQNQSSILGLANKSLKVKIPNTITTKDQNIAKLRTPLFSKISELTNPTKSQPQVSTTYSPPSKPSVSNSDNEPNSNQPAIVQSSENIKTNHTNKEDSNIIVSVAKSEPTNITTDFQAVQINQGPHHLEAETPDLSTSNLSPHKAQEELLKMESITNSTQKEEPSLNTKNKEQAKVQPSSQIISQQPTTKTVAPTTQPKQLAAKQTTQTSIFKQATEQKISQSSATTSTNLQNIQQKISQHTSPTTSISQTIVKTQSSHSSTTHITMQKETTSSISEHVSKGQPKAQSDNMAKENVASSVINSQSQPQPQIQPQRQKIPQTISQKPAITPKISPTAQTTTEANTSSTSASITATKQPSELPNSLQQPTIQPESKIIQTKTTATTTPELQKSVQPKPLSESADKTSTNKSNDTLESLLDLDEDISSLLPPLKPKVTTPPETQTTSTNKPISPAKPPPPSTSPTQKESLQQTQKNSSEFTQEDSNISLGPAFLDLDALLQETPLPPLKPKTQQTSQNVSQQTTPTKQPPKSLESDIFASLFESTEPPKPASKQPSPPTKLEQPAKAAVKPQKSKDPLEELANLTLDLDSLEIISSEPNNIDTTSTINSQPSAPPKSVTTSKSTPPTLTQPNSTTKNQPSNFSSKQSPSSTSKTKSEELPENLNFFDLDSLLSIDDLTQAKPSKPQASSQSTSTSGGSNTQLKTKSESKSSTPNKNLDDDIFGDFDISKFKI